jgi:hypothetical protein
MIPVNSDGESMMAAGWLFEELMIPSDFGTRDLAAQAIRMEAKRMGGVEKAAKIILAAARYAQRSGEKINRFWFQDQKYLRNLKIEAGADNQRQYSEDEARAIWQGMPEAYRKANPWGRA